MATNTHNPVPAMASVQTQLGCKIGKQTPAVTAQRSAVSAGRSMTARQRALVLDSLSKVKGEGFAQKCIQWFTGSVHLKSDVEIISMITDLQQQIREAPVALKSVLGDQYEFIRDLRFDK
jgi:hypothetical protein